MARGFHAGPVFGREHRVLHGVRRCPARLPAAPGFVRPGVVPGLPIPAAQFEEIIATCRDLDRHDRADTLVRLTLTKE
jgi:hypothetical protein